MSTRSHRAVLIRNRRQALGLSQRQLAKMCRVSWVTIWRLENDRTPGTLSTLKRIAAALGLSLIALIED